MLAALARFTAVSVDPNLFLQSGLLDLRMSGDGESSSMFAFPGERRRLSLPCKDVLSLGILYI